MLTCHFGFVFPSGPVCWFANWPPYSEGKERPKDEADHSRLIRSSFNKQENVQTTHLSFLGCVLEHGFHCGTTGHSIHSKDSEGGEAPPLPGYSFWVNWRSLPFNDFPQHYVFKIQLRWYSRTKFIATNDFVIPNGGCLPHSTCPFS